MNTNQTIAAKAYTYASMRQEIQIVGNGSTFRVSVAYEDKDLNRLVNYRLATFTNERDAREYANRVHAWGVQEQDLRGQLLIAREVSTEGLALVK